jgi:hypothetical protein
MWVLRVYSRESTVRTSTRNIPNAKVEILSHRANACIGSQF